MTGPRARQNSLRRTGFGTKHQVISPQIELLQRKRVERQHVTVPAPAAWYFLQERSLHRTPLQQRRQLFMICYHREHIRVGKHVRHRFHHTLSASPVDEPVVHDRNPRLLQIDYAVRYQLGRLLLLSYF